MWESIGKTAERIEREWSHAGYAREAFPDLAQREVEELLADGVLGIDGILASLASNADWPEQLDPHTQFGEPAVTVYKTERWNLDIYFWLHPVTALHDHRFCGAFGVVEGLTLNSTYDFQTSEPSPQRVETGRLVRRESELLRPGSVRRILPGRGSSIRSSISHARSFPPPFGPAASRICRRGPADRRDAGRRRGSVRVLDAVPAVSRRGQRLDAVTRVLDRTSSPIGRFREELTQSMISVAESSLYWNLARKEPHRLLVALATSLKDADEIAQRVEEYSGGEAAETVILEWLAGMKEEEEAVGRLANLEKRISPMARLGPRTAFLLRGILAAEDRAEILRRARSEFSEEQPERLAREIDELADRLGRMPILRPFLARWKQRTQSTRPH